MKFIFASRLPHNAAELSARTAGVNRGTKLFPVCISPACSLPASLGGAWAPKVCLRSTSGALWVSKTVFNYRFGHSAANRLIWPSTPRRASEGWKTPVPPWLLSRVLLL